jgi:hypothetical protein
MLTYNDKIFVGYRKKELEDEIQNIILVSEALGPRTRKLSPVHSLLSVIGKRMVSIGTRLEKRYGPLPNKDCCPNQFEKEATGLA